MLENLKPPARKTACAVRSILWTLSPDDYQILKDALANPLWSNQSLATGLNELGLTISPNSIARHKQKRCSCSDKD